MEIDLPEYGGLENDGRRTTVHSYPNHQYKNCYHNSTYSLYLNLTKGQYSVTV